jgi:hypothetical protein
MGQRRIGQLGFLDAALAQRGVTRQDVLAEINQLLDWSTFERLLLVIPTAAKGEPSYPALMMFKVLLLQRWYGLSDPAMEAALFEAARKLFRRKLAVCRATERRSERCLSSVRKCDRPKAPAR